MLFQGNEDEQPPPFDSAVAVPSLSKDPDDHLVIQPVCCCCIPCPRQTVFELMFARMRKRYGNPDGVSF